MRDPIPAEDIPPAPILSPQQALEDFETEDGFVVELVAAEPDVVDPVAASFDANGGMWVVEMRGYMANLDGSGEEEPVGRIVILADRDHDASYDTSIVFLDGLVMPRAVSVFHDGILYAEPPNLWWVDRNGYVAGRRTLVDSTYAVGGNPEHQPNGLVRAIDNWIYSANSPFRYRRDGGAWMKDSTEFRGQWGISQDDDGRLYYNNNSTTLVGDHFPPGAFQTNPNHYAQRTGKYATRMVDNRVYPRRMTPGINRAYRPGEIDEEGRLINVTSAAGPHVFRGDKLGPQLRGDAFISEPAANLVKRVMLIEDGGFVSGQMPYRDREFLTATDERFRPVNAYTAPDGSLYILDMYRGVIQHTTYLTDYLRRQIEARNLARPLGLGRIYRVRSTLEPVVGVDPLGARSDADLVNVLGDVNGWRRDTAQRLLVDRNATNVAGELRTLVTSGSSIARIHALWTLEGLGLLGTQDLVAARSADSSARVVRHLARLAQYANDRAPALQWLTLIATTPDRVAALHALVSLRTFIEANESAVLRIATDHMTPWSTDVTMLDAFMSVIAGREAQALALVDTGPVADALRAALVNAETRGALAAAALDAETLSAVEAGIQPFQQFCQPCHGADGTGLPNLAPTLVGSEWVLRDAETLAAIILDGVSGPIDVAGRRWNAAGDGALMPGLRGTPGASNAVIAAAMSYVRNAWGNRAPIVTAEMVEAVRGATSARAGRPYTEDELIRRRN